MASRMSFRLGLNSRQIFPRLARGFASTSFLLRVTDPLPKFSPTRSPDVDKILAEFRDEMVFPHHLTVEQKALINRPKNHQQLLDDPIFVEIGGESIQLLPKQGGVKYLRSKIITNIITSLSDPRDIDNILPFLEGLKQAGVTPTESHKQKILRACNLTGRTDILLRIACNVGKYGFLFTKATARECMRGALIEQAVPLRKFSTLKAIPHANKLMAIFASTAVKADPGVRLKRDPVVIGTALGIFADTSLRYNDRVDFHGLTEKWCRFLKDECWGDVELEVPGSVKGGGYPKSHLAKVRQVILDYTPVLEGLLAAKELLVKTDDLYSWLSTESEKLAEKIAGWKAFASAEKERLGEGPDVTRLDIEMYRAAAQLIQQRYQKKPDLGEEVLVGGEKEIADEGDDGSTEAERKELEALERGM